MDLYINTIKNNSQEVEVQLIDNKKVRARKLIKAQYQQAEKLLPVIERLLKSQQVNPMKIKKILVVNKDGSFTALRIGVVTANALGYALGVPVTDKRLQKVARGNGKFDIVKPVYCREPNITFPSSK